MIYNRVMLKAQAFANAFAGAAIGFYILLVILKVAAPPLFQLIFNSQFLGADIASQVPEMNLANLIGLLIAVGVITWIFGYLVAVIYNRFSK